MILKFLMYFNREIMVASHYTSRLIRGIFEKNKIKIKYNRALQNTHQKNTRTKPLLNGVFIRNTWFKRTAAVYVKAVQCV
jgi:hypothetical protein